MKVEVSQVIDRPLSDVFGFIAIDHVRNHPRWDPDMELEQLTEGPVRVGQVIRRVNSHGGTPVEGTMEVVEFEPERAMATVIHDGPVETHGRITFEAVEPDRTMVTISAESPAIDQSMLPAVRTLMERSAQNMKRLIETEL
jgi:hypothetical protein